MDNNLTKRMWPKLTICVSVRHQYMSHTRHTFKASTQRVSEVYYKSIIESKKTNMLYELHDNSTGHLYVKSDVYGFGVVLLEILTAMRALDTKRPTGQQNLVEWVKPFLSNKKKLKGIMDARIEGQYSPKAAVQAAALSLKCLENDPKQRPSMKEVLESLEAIEAIQVKTRRSNNNSHQPPVLQAARHHRVGKV